MDAPSLGSAELRVLIDADERRGDELSEPFPELSHVERVPDVLAGGRWSWGR